MIGWAFDSKGNMAPFDGPALAAAKVRDRADQREGRRRRPRRQDRDVRHEQQQPGEGEVVRREPARQGCGHHVHDLRRRLRDARSSRRRSRPGQARDRAVHRHRSDGPEALRQVGQAGVQLRQRRAGRGLGDGRVRLAQGLADGERSRRTRCSSTSRTSSRRSTSASRSSAARSSARESYATGANNVNAAVSRLNGRRRGRDRHRRRRSASCRRSSPGCARSATRRRS